MGLDLPKIAENIRIVGEDCQTPGLEVICDPDQAPHEVIEMTRKWLTEEVTGHFSHITFFGYDPQTDYEEGEQDQRVDVVHQRGHSDMGDSHIEPLLVSVRYDGPPRPFDIMVGEKSRIKRATGEWVDGLAPEKRKEAMTLMNGMGVNEAVMRKSLIYHPDAFFNQEEMADLHRHLESMMHRIRCKAGNVLALIRDDLMWHNRTLGLGEPHYETVEEQYAVKRRFLRFGRAGIEEYDPSLTMPACVEFFTFLETTNDNS